ncbi:MAG: c-type cytochrome biogenesis protein CcmI, partial [Proteobacteria bacterium]|nr:c-type cytochrome biogenesis protein CcmI [Pseudomonadota bacterium]
MALFVILGLMTVAAMALLVLPLLRGHGAIASRADYDIEIYRDQLDELKRDVERGVIDADEQASARTEIQRRILATESGSQEKRVTDTGGNGIIAAFAIMMLLPLAAGSLYLGLGSPGVVERPFAERPAAVPQMNANPDVEAMVTGLAARLEDESDDLEGWLMLGRSYSVLGRYGEAVAAMERARELDGEDPNILASLAENRVFAADGMVTPAAVAEFEMLQSIDRSHPAARFYLGLAHAQAGENRLALDEWIAFARQSPADAPWMEALREQITGVSAILGVPFPDGTEGMA